MMAKKKSKTKKRLSVAAIVLIVLALVFYWGAETVIENLVSREVQKQLNKNPSRHYNLHAGNIKIRFVSGNIWLEDLSLKATDSAHKMVQTGHLKNIFDFTLRDIEIKGLNVFRLLRNKKMELNNIKASNIHLNLYSNPEFAKNAGQDKFKLNDLFTDEFVSAAIGKIEIENFSAKRFLITDTSRPTLSLDSLYLTFTRVFADSQTIKKSIPVQFENLNVNSSNFLIKTSRFYKITSRDFAFNLNDSTLVIDGFKLIPRYTRHEFSKQVKYSTDWFNVSAERIALRNIHLSQLLNNNQIHLSKIEITTADVEIFRDKTLPDAPYKHKPLLASMLHRIPVPLLIDSLRVAGGKLQYEETPHDKKISGQLFFEPFALQAANLTNIDSVIATNPTSTLTFDAKIMGKSALWTSLKADLAGSSDYFEAEGELDQIPASALNPLVESLLFVSIVSGDIKKTSFYFYANDNSSSGEVFLEYENLKIEILNADDLSKQKVTQSFLANNLIRNSNLSSDRKYLVGKISHERDKNKGLPSYFWKSVQTGVISIIAPVASKESKAEKRKGKPGKKKG